MGNKNSNSGASNGISPKMPMSKIKDDSETGELELEPHASSLSRRKVPINFRDFHEYMIYEILRSPMDREEGLGQLAILPDECVLHIMSFMGLMDIGSVSCTSKLLFFLGRDESLWKLFYRRGMRRFDNAPRDDSFNFSKDVKGRQRRKEKKCGKWKGVCRLNFVRLPSGEGMILTEHLLGWSLDKVNELLGTCDEVTPVGRSGAYYYYHATGLAMSLEEDRVTSVLRNIPLESCTGPAYAKIVPRR